MNRLDEITTAYIGLLDVYDEVGGNILKLDEDYKALCKDAVLMMMKSVDNISTQHKMNFCLKAATWLCIEQISYINNQSKHISGIIPLGLDDLKRPLLRV